MFHRPDELILMHPMILLHKPDGTDLLVSALLPLRKIEVMQEEGVAVTTLDVALFPTPYMAMGPGIDSPTTQAIKVRETPAEVMGQFQKFNDWLRAKEIEDQAEMGRFAPGDFGGGGGRMVRLPQDPGGRGRGDVEVGDPPKQTAWNPYGA